MEEHGVRYIRAVQGHTIKTVQNEELLDKITNPFAYNQVIHGTYMQPLPQIMQSGLNKMARNHVHMAVGLPGNGVISGMRGSCEVVIEVNMVKAMHANPPVPFWISQNKVVLSEGLADGSIPAAYFRWVLDYRQKKFLHQAPIEFICVYDFECTCTNDKANPLQTQEVIEFPIVVIDVRQKAIVAEFQTYVKPEIDTQLTPFCTELTGITQEQVDAGIPLAEALNQAHAFLEA